MSLIFGLPRPNLLNKDGNFTPPWSGWFSRVQFILLGIGATGTTAQRPTDGTMLWVGYEYFDSTLGFPIWASAVTPTVVWVRYDGTVV